MPTSEVVHNKSQGTRSMTDSSLHKSQKKKMPATDDLIFQSSGVMQFVVAKRLNQRPVPASQPAREEDEDDLLGKTMTRLVKGISNDMAKEQAKLECPQLLFRYRFQHILQHQNQPHFDSPLHSPTQNLTSHSGGFNSYLSSIYVSPSIPAYGSYESETGPQVVLLFQRKFTEVHHFQKHKLVHQSILSTVLILDKIDIRSRKITYMYNFLIIFIFHSVSFCYLQESLDYIFYIVFH